MHKLEPEVVLRFCAAVGEFLKLRVFTQEEVAELLKVSQIPDSIAYRQLVINACVVNHSEVILPLLGQMITSKERSSLEEAVYSVCVQVNPALDIRNVTLRITPGEMSELHLLEQPVPAAGTEALLPSRRVVLLQEELRRRIIGQPEAVQVVCRALSRSLAGLRDLSRPIGSFLFVGQTGVGKTEFARVLARLLYGGLDRLIRVDCSEYSSPHEYAKLIGAPPGYVGHDEGGYLTETLKRRGSGVVLFDEVEKADDKVHDLLLQVFEEGALTDAKGLRVPFAETIVLLTSNLGARDVEHYRSHPGFDASRRESVSREDRLLIIQEVLKREFKPEFINRLDEIVLFNPLTLSDCEEIVDLLLGEVAHRAVSRHLTLAFSPDVRSFLARRGYDPEWGARELRRTVEREVEVPLSEQLISGAIHDGDRVSVEVSKDHIQFSLN